MLSSGLMLGGFAPALAQTAATQVSTSQDSTQTQRPLTYPQRLLYRGAEVIHRPFMSDSLNVHGKPFDDSSLIPKAVPNPLIAHYDTISASGDNVYLLKRATKRTDGDKELHHYATYLLPTTYTKGRVSVMSSLPWELYLDGTQVGKGSRQTDGSTQSEPSYTDVTLTAGTHTLVLRVDASASPIDSLGSSIQLGWSSDRADRPVALLTAPKKYPDLEYMIYGGSLSGSTTSPSGRYTLISEREFVNRDKATRRTWLYRDGRRLYELTGDLASARWMPESDRLYWDATTAQGRVLYTWSPDSGERMVLATGIPSGHYYITPQEQTLIVYSKEDGTPYKKTLDRFASPDERMSGYRDRYLLSIYDLKSGTTQPLTFGARSTTLQDISRDGRKLIYSITTETPTVRPFSQTAYYELDVQTLQVDTLLKDCRGVRHLYYTARPDQLLVKGTAEAFDRIGSLLAPDAPINSYDEQLFLYDRSRGVARPLTRTFDRTIGEVQLPLDRYEAYFLAEVGDRRLLHHLDLASGRITMISPEVDVVKSFSVSTSGRAVSFIGQSALISDRGYIRQSGKKQNQLVWDYAQHKMQGLELGETHEWNWQAPDGTTIQGRYYLPPQFDPKKKYPMLVYYYGGTAPVNRGLDQAYSLPMFAALGYVVYTLNPSGSTGYGQEFAARHINAWGKRTADEIIGAVKDFAAQHEYVNAERIGCFGASYGGFMTQYLQTQTDLFAAAVSHAGISAIASYWGEGYWGVGYSTVASQDSYPWNNPQLYTEHSPLYLADKINTPLLLIHGMSDTNVPIGESWQMFNALRILGKPVEFIGVYGEDHWILDPQKRYEWSSAIMAFFAKYLQDDPTWWEDTFGKQ